MANASDRDGGAACDRSASIDMLSARTLHSATAPLKSASRDHVFTVPPKAVESCGPATMATEMDEDVPSSSFEVFAQAYRTARNLDVGAQLDPESGTALVFADLCAERTQAAPVSVPHLQDHYTDDDAAWEAEEHTWKLIHALFAYVYTHL